MAKNAIKQTVANSRGFSLLELLVTLAIISVLTGVAVTQLVINRSEQNLDDSLREFTQLYLAVHSESLLSGTVFRLRLINNKQFLIEKKQQNVWQEAARDVSVPQWHNTFLQLVPDKPLLILPTGQSTSFRLSLTQDGIVKILSADALGRITIATP